MALHVADAASGLIYMQQRYYDPVIGRFLSTDPDPVGELGLNFNRYAYAANNPYKYVDPDGRAFELMYGIAGFAAADAAVPEPTDAAAPAKAVVYGSAIVGAALGGLIVYAAEKLTEPAAAPAEGSPEINPLDVEGKSPTEIGKLATDAGLVAKGSNPEGGKGAYIDPVTGKQRVLIHGDHGHVNDAEGNRLDRNGNKVPNESPEAHLPIKSK